MANQEDPRPVNLTYSGGNDLVVPYGLFQPPECLFGSILQVEATAVNISGPHGQIQSIRGVNLHCQSCVFEPDYSGKQSELSVGYGCPGSGRAELGFDRYYLKCQNSACENHAEHTR